MEKYSFHVLQGGGCRCIVDTRGKKWGKVGEGCGKHSSLNSPRLVMTKGDDHETWGIQGGHVFGSTFLRSRTAKRDEQASTAFKEEQLKPSASYVYW